MSKGGGWVPIDKELVKTLGNLNRQYSELEAMFSHTVNVDSGNEWTYRGYAKIWQWSVGKVKRFVEGMMNTSGTVVGRKGNGSGTEVHFIDKGLWVLDEQKVNGSGTVDEHKVVAISNPNPNPKKTTTKAKAAFSVPEWVDKELWKDFLLMRSKIKKPVTSQQAVSGLTNKLKSLTEQGYSQSQLFEAALIGCWQTFYEPKDQQKEPEDTYVWGQGAEQ